MKDRSNVFSDKLETSVDIGQTSVEYALKALGQADLDLSEVIITQGLRSHPDNPQWARCLVEFLSRKGQFKEALVLAENLVKKGFESPELMHTIARLKVSLGYLREGLGLFNRLRPHNLFGDPPIKTSAPLWQGESLVGKSICIATEGGVGDVICFVRFAQEFSQRGAKVIVASYPPLFQLLKTVPGVDFVIDREATDRVYFDYWVPALSQPGLLHLEPSHISGQPYLQTDPLLKQKWRYLVTDPRPRVGVCWQGRKEFVEDNLRSIAATQFLPLIDIKAIAWYKIQLFEGDNTLNHPNLIDLTSHISCPNQLAAHIANLDLLISVDSAPAHIAGALGTPVWLLNRFFGWITFSCPNPHLDVVGRDPEGLSNQALWYDSMEIYTQKYFGKWRDPLEKIERDLGSWVTKFRQAHHFYSKGNDRENQSNHTLS